MPENPLWEYARRSLRNLGMGLDAGVANMQQGNQAILRGADATLQKMRGADLTPEQSSAIQDSPIGGMGTGTIGAGGAFMGTFAGRLARVPNKRQLSSAMRAAAKGMGTDEIRARYGWFQAPDGDWKFEIPDNAARLIDDGQGGWRLEHPELMRAYPELKQYRIEPHSKVDELAEATHDAKERRITLADSLSPQDALKSLIHEMQHGVQTIEGFNPGASPWRPEVKAIANERFNRIYSDAHDTMQEFNGALNDWFNQQPRPATFQESRLMRARFIAEHPELARRYEDATDILDNPSKHMNLQRFQVYERTLGETEARDASERINLTPEQRATISPYYLGRVREVRTPFDPADDIDLRAWRATQPKAADVPPEQAELVRGMGVLSPETKALIISVLGLGATTKTAE